MTKKTVLEIVLVSLLTAGFIVGARMLPAVPKVVVGNRTWIVSWAAPPENSTSGGAQVTNAFPSGRSHGQTLRENVTLSIGGAAFRIRFSNQFGDMPLLLSRVTVAPALPNQAMDRKHMHSLRFNTAPGAFVSPGQEVTSDPIPMAVTPNEQLAISLAVFGTSPTPTLHQFAGVTNGISALGTNDVTTTPKGTPFSTHTTAEFWLAAVEVLNPPGQAHAVVALGDSLTDAYFLDNNDPTWPQLLFHRLQTAGDAPGLGVINGAIVANTVTDVGCTDCGTPLVSRVVRDAVDLPGVDCAIVLGGTNDISRGATAASVVHGLATVLGTLHAHHIKAIGVTIPPRDEGSYGWVERTMDPVRQAVNGWLRGAKAFDGLVDADQLLQDPSGPDQIAVAFSTDGTHLTDAGRAAVANAIPLAELQGCD